MGMYFKFYEKNYNGHRKSYHLTAWVFTKNKCVVIISKTYPKHFREHI